MLLIFVAKDLGGAAIYFMRNGDLSSDLEFHSGAMKSPGGDTKAKKCKWLG